MTQPLPGSRHPGHRSRPGRSRSRPLPLERDASPAGHEDGRAIIEVVFLAVLLLIPVAYIMVAVVRLQAATLAVSQAARDSGRLIETVDDPAAGGIYQVARVALNDQHISDGALSIRVVATGADCRQAPEVPLSRQPGASYDVCVIAVVTLPAVPTILAGSANTVIGVYTVHIGELREGR